MTTRPSGQPAVGDAVGLAGAGEVAGAAAGFPQLLDDVRGALEPLLARVWDEALAEHERYGSAVTRPLEAARALCMRGGKRLRAGLVAVGYCLGSGASEWAPALPVCCAVELLQAYFLIHDDWMDQDRVRRGGPAVHAALESELPSVHLAACGAVLAGDYTLALATRCLSRAVPDNPARLLDRFAQMQLDAVVGQQLDVLGDGRDIEAVYRLKTASYTVFGPLVLGLELCGAAERWAASMEAFAMPSGVAFQLRDDLIGAFGEPALTGKPRGSDVRAGKRTPLVSLAARLADAEGARTIAAALGNSAADAALLEAALGAIEASGARQHVERRIQALAEEALSALEAPIMGARARELLKGVLHSMIQRGA